MTDYELFDRAEAHLASTGWRCEHGTWVSPDGVRVTYSPAGLVTVNDTTVGGQAAHYTARDAAEFLAATSRVVAWPAGLVDAAGGVW